MATIHAPVRETVSDVEQELLIREARRPTRRRRVGLGALVLAVLGVVSGMLMTVGGGPSSTPKVAGRSPGASSSQLITPGTTLNAKSVVALTMFTRNSGIAVNTLWNATGQHPTMSYLTRTSNSGTTWRITTALPRVFISPLLTFASPRVGYLADAWGEHSLFVTRDAGATWTPMALVGEPTSITTSGDAVWVSANRCAKGLNVQSPWCPTYLTIYRLGSTTPVTSRRIPALDHALRAALPDSPRTLSARVLARTGTDSAVVVEGSDDPNSVLTTSNSGRSWTPLPSPCGQLSVDSMVTTTSGTWLLMCTAPVGAGGANNALYRSTNTGGSWTLVAKSNHQGAKPNDLYGAEPDVFGANQNGSVLWFSFGVGLMQTSVNGGRTWKFSGRNLVQITQQSFVSRGTFGWLAAYEGGLMRTTDGVHWRWVRGGR